jgi:hypothetical protein
MVFSSLRNLIGSMYKMVGDKLQIRKATKKENLLTKEFKVTSMLNSVM